MAQVTPMACDLSSLAAVRAFAQSFLDTGLLLHVLINNAAVMVRERGCARVLTKRATLSTYARNLSRVRPLFPSDQCLQA